MTAVYVVGGILLYLFFGLCFARIAYITVKNSSMKSGDSENDADGSAMNWAFAMLVIWPVLLPITLILWVFANWVINDTKADKARKQKDQEKQEQAEFNRKYQNAMKVLEDDSKREDSELWRFIRDEAESGVKEANKLRENEEYVRNVRAKYDRKISPEDYL